MLHRAVRDLRLAGTILAVPSGVLARSLLIWRRFSLPPRESAAGALVEGFLAISARRSFLVAFAASGTSSSA